MIVSFKCFDTLTGNNWIRSHYSYDATLREIWQQKNNEKEVFKKKLLHTTDAWSL